MGKENTTWAMNGICANEDAKSCEKSFEGISMSISLFSYFIFLVTNSIMAYLLSLKREQKNEAYWGTNLGNYSMEKIYSVKFFWASKILRLKMLSRMTSMFLYAWKSICNPPILMQNMDVTVVLTLNSKIRVSSKFCSRQIKVSQTQRIWKSQINADEFRRHELTIRLWRQDLKIGICMS